MKSYRTTTNCNPDKEEKMALDWTYLVKPTGSIEMLALDWNPQGGSKVWLSEKDL
jgi:hypothetical protein